MSGLRVLLVEDNPGDQELVRTYLADSFDPSVELRCASSLSAAGRMIEEAQDLDIVLLDLGLPDVSGVEVVSAVRRLDAEVPIVVLTGDVSPESGEKALALDAQDYLLKDELDAVTLGRSLRYALQRSRWQQQYRRQLSASPDGMLVVADDGRVRFANRAAEEMLGAAPKLREDLPAGVKEAHSVPVDVQLENGRVVEARSVDTEWQGLPAVLISLRDMTDRRAAERALARMTEELREANDRLAELVSTDPLTNVLNRRGLEEALGLELDRAERSGDQVIGILVDFDDFKGVNDRYGHAVGDAALQALTRSLGAALRGHDHVGRVGGDEFLVVLTDATIAEGMTVADKLRRIIGSTTLPVADGTISLSASFAVGVLEPGTMTIEQVLTSLGSALRTSKDEGKNRVSAIAGTLGAGAPHYEDLDANGIRLQVALQPICRVDSAEPIGSEALTRGPPGAFEMPGDLFRAAFEQDVLTTLDLRALTTNLDVLRTVDSPGTHHVNLFPSTLLNTPADRLIKMLDNGIDLPRLCIELSEQQFLGDPTYLREPLAALKAAGVRIAIDDVGFGRSSIEALLVLEPDVVKVDRHCVQGIERHRVERRQLQRLLEMLGAVGAQVIVEGVEHAAEVAVLGDLGVEFAQGFFWGEPVRAYGSG